RDLRDHVVAHEHVRDRRAHVRVVPRVGEVIDPEVAADLLRERHGLAALLLRSTSLDQSSDAEAELVRLVRRHPVTGVDVLRGDGARGEMSQVSPKGPRAEPAHTARLALAPPKGPPRDVSAHALETP